MVRGQFLSTAGAGPHGGELAKMAAKGQLREAKYNIKIEKEEFFVSFINYCSAGHPAEKKTIEH